MGSRRAYCSAPRPIEAAAPTSTFPRKNRLSLRHDYVFSLSPPHRTSPPPPTVLIDADTDVSRSLLDFLRRCRLLSLSYPSSLSCGDVRSYSLPSSLFPVLPSLLLSLGVVISPANPLTNQGGGELTHRNLIVVIAAFHHVCVQWGKHCGDGDGQFRENAGEYRRVIRVDFMPVAPPWWWHG
ncbi:hypothetical protein Cgig2_023377 [Carnegiea gigantea]|uniref:Uncharacterized protein n=1 Tax=Carnegiea gigantea TaxID=171969 RepID=A0A9Q1GL74_9CARY|nr:hypothetical protein Cgig2_023377 [Carnegiea gigantea]